MLTGVGFGGAFAGITVATLKIISNLNFASSDFKDETNRRKFNKNVAAVIYYSCTTLWAMWIAISKNFDLKEMMRSYDLHNPQEAAYIYFYTVQIGFYALEIYNVLFSSNKPTDRARLILHHLLCFSLILVSLYCGYWRVGFFTLLLHDASDVFLYAAKATQYHFRETGRLESLVTLLFGIFVFAFVVARVILFPLLVIRPGALSDAVLCKPDSLYLADLVPDHATGLFNCALYVALRVLWVVPLHVAGVKDPSCITLTLVCAWSLCVLFLLQLSWLVNIISQIFRVKDKGIGAEDVRSDDEEEESEDDKQK